MRVAIVYFLTMSLVILGVFWILRLGEHLTAPASVKGTWKVNSLQVISGTGACTGSLDWAEDPSLIILQSGPELVITLGDNHLTTLKGSLQEMEVKAEEIHPRDTTRGMELEAELDLGVEPDRLEGMLYLPRCGGAFEIVAARLPAEILVEEGE